MRWLLIIGMVGFVYSDVRPVQSPPPREIAKPLEDLVPMLENVTEKLTDLSDKIEKL